MPDPIAQVIQGIMTNPPTAMIAAHLLTSAPPIPYASATLPEASFLGYAPSVFQPLTFAAFAAANILECDGVATFFNLDPDPVTGLWGIALTMLNPEDIVLGVYQFSGSDPTSMPMGSTTWNITLAAQFSQAIT